LNSAILGCTQVTTVPAVAAPTDIDATDKSKVVIDKKEEADATSSSSAMVVKDMEDINSGTSNNNKNSGSFRVVLNEGVVVARESVSAARESLVLTATAAVSSASSAGGWFKRRLSGSLLNLACDDVNA
jgi:hypothetical protein